MPSKKIIILSMAISLFAHVLLLSATGLFERPLGKPKQETSISVNLKETPEIRPEVAKKKNIVKEPPPASPLAEVAETEVSEEETISLDSNDERYVPYLKKIKQRIERIWSYPPEAFKEKKGGVSTVSFSLDSQGRLVDSKIIASSGHAALDQATINVIMAAAPYAPFPQEITLSRLNIQATFQYRFLR
jgi:TonB family protein